MGEHFHIIIAGDQHRPFSFRVSMRNALLTAGLIFAISSALLSTGVFTSGLYAHNSILTKKMVSLKEEMKETKGINSDLEMQIADLARKNQKAIEDLQNTYDLEIAALKEKHATRIAKLTGAHSDEVNKLVAKYSTKVAKLEKQNQEQSKSFEEEKELLLSTAVSELNQRSKFIEDVITDIGIDIKKRKIKSSSKNKGGPFVAAENSRYDELLYRTDNYIETMQTTPLGRPVKGSVSSWFGKRKDPLNHKSAFHEGIDFRGRTGDPIIATAEGKVIYAGKNGGYGNFIKIAHSGGYTTSYAHLHKILVRPGEQVTRGQKIGTVGNSGRSTGSHLHYEILHRGRPVDPAKFMKVASLTCKLTEAPEKK